MNTQNTKFQIVAITKTGINLIWDERQNDFVSFEKEVVDTDLESLSSARNCASKYCPNILSVWGELINLETGELLSFVK